MLWVKKLNAQLEKGGESKLALFVSTEEITHSIVLSHNKAFKDDKAPRSDEEIPVHEKQDSSTANPCFPYSGDFQW